MHHAHIVVLATDSPTPVLDAAWVADGAFVTTRSEQIGRAEFDARLVDAADVTVTDSPAQITAYDPRASSRARRRPHGSSRSATSWPDAHQAAPHRPSASCSSRSGLAGAEVALLAHLAAR